MDEDIKILHKPDPAFQETLISEVIPDPMEGEQTWPTEEELREAGYLIIYYYMVQITSGDIVRYDWLRRSYCRSSLSRNRPVRFENFSDFVWNSQFGNFHCCCSYLDV